MVWVFICFVKYSMFFGRCSSTPRARVPAAGFHGAFVLLSDGVSSDTCTPEAAPGGYLVVRATSRGQLETSPLPGAPRGRTVP